jgi:hypothetical protein
VDREDRAEQEEDARRLTLRTIARHVEGPESKQPCPAAVPTFPALAGIPTGAPGLIAAFVPASLRCDVVFLIMIDAQLICVSRCLKFQDGLTPATPSPYCGALLSTLAMFHFTFDCAHLRPHKVQTIRHFHRALAFFDTRGPLNASYVPLAGPNTFARSFSFGPDVRNMLYFPCSISLFCLCHDR